MIDFDSDFTPTQSSTQKNSGNCFEQTQIAVLLTRYGFELKGFTPLELIERWLNLYPAKWVRLAVIEALYQGRYKAISVEQILSIWQRRGQPTYHFTFDFERLVFRVLPPAQESDPTVESTQEKERSPNNKAYNPQKKPFTNASAQISPAIAKANENNSASPSQTTPNPSVELENSPKSARQVDASSEPRIEEKPTASARLKTDLRLAWENSQRGIHEFMPAIDPSAFYSKLRAVVRQDKQADTNL
jgi:hypothetical protein